MRLGLLSYFLGFLTGLWDFEGAIADPLGTPKATSDEGYRPDPLG